MIDANFEFYLEILCFGLLQILHANVLVVVSEEQNVCILKNIIFGGILD